MDYKPQFKVPDEKQRQDAFGGLAGVPIRLKKCLSVIYPYFKPIPAPGPSDWLANQEEEGQTFQSYLYQMKNKLDENHNIIYIQPLEPIAQEFLSMLQNFCQAYYFGVQVKILKLLDVASMQGIDNRINDSSGKKQYNATQILKKLQLQLPKGAYCVIGVLQTDIYNRDDWNFVFGIASILNRTGVFSFARYDEAFFDNSVKTNSDIILLRACKVMAHEIGHMFGLRHCIYFSCLMSGSNHLEETNAKPIEFCPVCIRKLQSNLQFDMLMRYEAMNEICKQNPAFIDNCQFYEMITNDIKKAYGPHYSIQPPQQQQKLQMK